jgi:hypothetical protein
MKNTKQHNFINPDWPRLKGSIQRQGTRVVLIGGKHPATSVIRHSDRLNDLQRIKFDNKGFRFYLQKLLTVFDNNWPTIKKIFLCNI